MRDNQDNLWFFYAQDIKIRKGKERIQQQKAVIKVDYFKSKTREEVNKELDEFALK